MAPTKTRDNNISIHGLKQLKKEKRKWKEKKLLTMAGKMKNVSENSVPKDVSPKTEVFHGVSTLSIAVPGSILENAQSPELRTYLAGQIARAAGIFKIDEVSFFFLFL